MSRSRQNRNQEPVWEPLIELVGLEVVGCFMWMCQLEIDGDVPVQVYKQIATRRHLHLTADGRAFEVQPSGYYAQVTPREALVNAFEDWEELVPSPPDADAVRELLDDLVGDAR